MCVKDLFQFCAVAAHTIPDSFSFRREKLSGMGWTYPSQAVTDPGDQKLRPEGPKKIFSETPSPSYLSDGEGKELRTLQ